MLKGRTPLGWLQLNHNKTRLVVSCAGVGFAVVLVFMQLGFMNMLFDATVLLHTKLNADVVLLDVEAKDMNQTGSFSRRRLVQALGVEGVKDAEALYIGTTNWVKPSNGESGQLLTLAVQPDFFAFNDPEVQNQLPLLRLQGSFLFDRGSRGDYSDFISSIASDDAPVVEINETQVSPVGTFRFGASFSTEAIAIMSTESYFALQASDTPATVNVGLVHVQPGYDARDVARRIEAATGAEVKAMTMEDFIALSRSRIAEESPVSIVFTFGSIVGLFVGAIIVIQVLSSDVQDHLGEYATFKAMGFTNRHLLGIVYEQSTILTFFGFLPALGLSYLLYWIVGMAVSMNMTMTVDRIAFVFALTVVMCAVSGTIAMRRIYRADPADVF